MAIAKVVADFNLAVRYGIAMRIHVYASKKFWQILIWRLLRSTTKPPNLISGYMVIAILHVVGYCYPFYCTRLSYHSPSVSLVCWERG